MSCIMGESLLTKDENTEQVSNPCICSHGLNEESWILGWR